ncbi:MAG: sigma-70 family RNA polymerase sigma factor [Longimicrobiales bacterium]
MDRDKRFEIEALPHIKLLFGTAFRLTRNAHDAEDLVQETFLRAYQSFDSYTPGTRIRAWLYTILYRVRIDAYRRRRRSPLTVELTDDGPSIAPAQEALFCGEDIARALEHVPETFRIPVLLRDVQDFSYDEIARNLDIPIGTVMSRIHRGRALLRKALGSRRPRA